MLKLKLFMIFLIILAFQVLKVDNRTFVKLTGIECKAIDASYTNFTVCKLKAVKRDVTEISVWATLYKKPITNMSVTIEIRKRGNLRSKPILEITIDGCFFLNSQRRNPLAGVLYDALGLAKCSSFNHTCPYDHDIYVTRCIVDVKYMRLTSLRSGFYTLHSKWYSFNVLRSIVTLNTEISEA